MTKKQLREHKPYLGDSVYAAFDGYHIILTTENGFGPSNTIALEPAVLEALNRYAEWLETQPTTGEPNAS